MPANSRWDLIQGFKGYIYIYIYIYIYDISSLKVDDLTLILLTWRKW